MRQHKLFWGSSYDIIDKIRKMCYNIIYDKHKVRTMWKRIQNLQSVVKKIFSSFLFKDMQIRMEQNINRILERQENAIHEEKQTHKRRNESKLERGTEDGQEWIYFNPFSKPPILRRGQVRKRTPYYYGKKTKSLFISTGGCSSY